MAREGDLVPLRVDDQGRLLCSAHSKRTGLLCNGPAVRGTRVCRQHGGTTKAARRGATLRLAGLVDPAITTLAREMVGADKSSDRQRAANSVLDRAGYPRERRLEAKDAREILLQRLLEMQGEGEGDDELDPVTDEGYNDEETSP